MRLLALGLALALLLPLAVGAPSIDVASSPTTPRVQTVVDTFLKIPEIKQNFEEGDTLLVVVGTSSWHATIASGAAPLVNGTIEGPTHTLRVDPNAMLSIINAYDRANTAKLALKRNHMTAESERPAVKLAIGAIARTPLDARLAAQEPYVWQNFTFSGCPSTIFAKKKTAPRMSPPIAALLGSRSTRSVA